MLLQSLIAAFLAFLAMFCLQAMLSRVFRPRSEDRFIFSLFLIFPSACFLLAASLGAFPILIGLPAFVLYFAIASGWVASYPAVYASCPSLMISYFLSKSPKGLALEEIIGLIDVQQSSTARVQDALELQWVQKDGDALVLTSRGRFFYRFFSAYRSALGRKLDPL